MNKKSRKLFRKLLLFWCLIFYSPLKSYNEEHLTRVLGGEKDIRGFDLRGALLKGFVFSDVDARGTDFRGAHLQDALFINSRAEGALFQNSFLARLTIINSCFDDTYFDGATAQCLKVYVSSFCNTSFRHFFAKKALFFCVDISGSYLMKSNFRNTRFYGTDFSVAANCADVQFNGLRRLTPDEQAKAFNELAFQLMGWKNDDLQVPTEIFWASECPICRNEFIEGQAVAVFLCGHIFCSSCADGVLNIRQECPLCREVIDGYPTIMWQNREEVR